MPDAESVTPSAPRGPEEEFAALVEAHRDHTWKQVGPCVYCISCADAIGRPVRLFQGTSTRAWPDDGDVEPDYEDWLAWNQPTDEDAIPTACPVCHAIGACGYDAEGRALIHSLNADEAAESAVEETVNG